MDRQSKSQKESAADRRRRFWLALVTGGLALVVYLVTRSPGVHPVGSAGIVARAIGLRPEMSPMMPLWRLLARGLAAQSVGSLALRLHVLAALCGAAVVVLTGLITYRALYLLLKRDRWNQPLAGRTAWVGGAGASLFALFCLPLWLVATRAHYLGFHVGLLLALFYIALLALPALTAGRAALLCFFYGIGIVESTTFIPFAPVFAVLILAGLWNTGRLRSRALLLVGSGGLAGLLFYAAGVGLFLGSEGAALRDVSGFWSGLFWFWKDQYITLARSLPRIGWLLVLLLTVIPWLTVLGLANWALNSRRSWETYALHVALLAVSILVLLNAQGSPWAFLQERRLLLAPYCLSAMTFGYLMAFWYLTFAAGWTGREDPMARRLRNVCSAAVLFPFAVLLFWAPVRNLPTVDAAFTRVTDAYAGIMLDSLEGRDWLVTDGVFDDVLLLQAYDRGQQLSLINMRHGGQAHYRRYLAGKFESPRLRNMARVGLAPLLQEWLSSDPTVPARVAVQSIPDLWVSAGLEAVPHHLLFLGRKETASLDVDTIWRQHRTFWSELETLLRVPPGSADVSRYYAQYMSRHAGFLANNLGVLLEDLQAPEAAWNAYQQARAFDPDNVSALLNLYVLANQGLYPEQADAIRDALNTLIEGLNERIEIWRLARYYGYVRLPTAFAELGWTWALSGQPGLAARGLRRAIELAPEERRHMLRQQLAGIYFMGDETAESEVLFFEILAEEPENPRALLGLARVKIRQGELGRAAEYLEKAQAAGSRPTVLRMAWAELHLAGGDQAAARVILEELVELQPKLRDVWAMLFSVLVAQQDAVALERRLADLRNQGLESQYLETAARGHLARMSGNWDDARRYFGRALELQPAATGLLEVLLRRDMHDGDLTRAEHHATRLLAHEPEHFLANYVMGNIQSRRGERDVAENSLRRSLQSRTTAMALNDLAWLLQDQQQYDEAEVLARQAVAINENMYNAWDTLGVILMKQQDLAEAELAFERALAFPQADFMVFVHMAELQVLRGNKARAAELLGVVEEQWRRVPARVQLRVNWLREELMRMR